MNICVYTYSMNNDKKPDIITIIIRKKKTGRDIFEYFIRSCRTKIVTKVQVLFSLLIL